jgi:hypothetical protein
MTSSHPDQKDPRPDDQTKIGGGMQGVDKAPGEENSRSTDNPVQDTQRAKNKNDGDPSRFSDQPVEEKRS